MMKNKIALILPANLWFSPYLDIYTRILDEMKIDYDIINWDRNLDEKCDTIKFSLKDRDSKISKFIGYLKFSQFVKKKITENKYTLIIVFGAHIGIFLYKFLEKNYKRKYIFDYRDLSIEQYKFLRPFFKILLDNSYANVISSPGFKKCLPKEYNYILSHNFNIDHVKEGLKKERESISFKNIKVLTIGGIRDANSNQQIIDSLGDNDNFKLKFAGQGPASDLLKEYCEKKKYYNVQFSGYYDKKDEPDIIKNSTFLNIFYPNLITHSTALSNRFYNSIIYRKPMITTKGQIQGDFCEKYDLGIAINDTNNLSEKLNTWLKKVNYNDYQDRCIKLLESFVEDYNRFKSMLISFITLK